MANRQARYKVGDVIGGQFKVYEVHMGGMGEVYLCLDEKENLPFALKTFQNSYSQLSAIFEHEVQTWINLGKHPHIVRCGWMQKIDDVPFLVLEWVLGDANYGVDLRSWLRYGALDLKKAIKFTIDICRGLDYAQQKVIGIIHRDLKPENVLVSQDQLAKITDFGLSTIQHKTGDDSIEDKQAHVMGTPAYMSPEQWRGDSDIDARVDIYAVGCMLYEMLSGRLPYIATTIHKMRLHHLESPIPQLDNMPSHINKIIQTCLEKERDRRYGSVQALLQELTLFYEANFGKLSPLIVNEIMNASDYNHRGGTYFGLKKYELALTDFDEAIRLDPHYALAYMNRANLYLEKGQYNQAITDYNHAIQYDSNNPLAYYNRGNGYQKLGMFQQSILDYTQAIQLDNRFAIAHANRANSYANLGQYPQAFTDYEQALHLKPDDAITYVDRGVTYLETGKFEQAMKDFDTAIQLNPDFAMAYVNRGNGYSQLKRYQEAIADYDKAIQLLPQLATAWLKKGLLCALTGQFNDAFLYMNKAHQLGDPTALDMIQQVQYILHGS